MVKWSKHEQMCIRSWCLMLYFPFSMLEQYCCKMLTLRWPGGVASTSTPQQVFLVFLAIGNGKGFYCNKIFSCSLILLAIMSSSIFIYCATLGKDLSVGASPRHLNSKARPPPGVASENVSCIHIGLRPYMCE